MRLLKALWSIINAFILGLFGIMNSSVGAGAKPASKEDADQAKEAAEANADAKPKVPEGYYQDANGRWHRPNGQFASNAELGLPSAEDGHYLHRPYIRKDTLDAVNENTQYNSDGQLWDKIGEKYVDPGNVELGHVPGNEFAFERDVAESLGWSQQQFNDHMNNPEFYAWQNIHDNRSHAFEMKH